MAEGTLQCQACREEAVRHSRRRVLWNVVRSFSTVPRAKVYTRGGRHKVAATHMSCRKKWLHYSRDFIWRYWCVRALPCVEETVRKCGTQARTRYIDITHVVQRHGSELCRCLPGLHAFTCCAESLFRVRKTDWIEFDEGTREIQRAIPSPWYWVASYRISCLHASRSSLASSTAQIQWCKWPAVPSLLHQGKRPRLQPATTMRRRSAQALRPGQLPACDMAPKSPELLADTSPVGHGWLSTGWVESQRPWLCWSCYRASVRGAASCQTALVFQMVYSARICVDCKTVPIGMRTRRRLSPRLTTTMMIRHVLTSRRNVINTIYVKQNGSCTERLYSVVKDSLTSINVAMVMKKKLRFWGHILFINHIYSWKL